MFIPKKKMNTEWKSYDVGINSSGNIFMVLYGDTYMYLLAERETGRICPSGLPPDVSFSEYIRKNPVLYLGNLQNFAESLLVNTTDYTKWFDK